MDQDRILRVMMDSLRLDELPPADSTMETLEKWDSLNHLHLMMDLEREFGIRFNSDRIPDLTSIEAIREEIESGKT